MLTIEPHLRKSLFMKLRETWMCSFFVAREPTCQHSGWDLGWEKMTGVILLPSRKSLLQKMPCLKYRRLHVRNSTQKNAKCHKRGNIQARNLFIFLHQNSWRKAWKIAIFNLIHNRPITATIAQHFFLTWRTQFPISKYKANENLKQKK